MSNKYSKAELNKFKKSIKHKISLIANEVDTIKEGLGSSSNKQGGLTPDSIYSVHMADAGTDSYEREKGFHLMNRENDYIQLLHLAIQRIDSGDFGICKVCGSKIPEERMMEVPNATKCVNCKENEKLNINQA